MSGQAIKSELVALQADRSRFGNESVDGFLTEAERAKVMADAALKLEELFDVLRIDHRNDHNMRDTPARVAKMYVEEILRGRFVPPPAITEFDNVEQCDQLIVTGPIDVRSTCAHHLMPIYGECYIGIVPSPDGKIIGLSKYDRLVDYFSSRFQIQEELVKQIERHIVETTAPRGLAIRISAVHMCKTHRGIRASHDARMITTTYYGCMADDRDLKNEFLQECVGLQR